MLFNTSWTKNQSKDPWSNESGQTINKFTNLDFPESRGPISLPKSYLLGAQVMFSVAVIRPDEINRRTNLFFKASTHEMNEFMKIIF